MSVVRGLAHLTDNYLAQWMATGDGKCGNEFNFKKIDAQSIFAGFLLNILPKKPQVIDPLLFFKQPLDIYLKLAICLLMNYLEMDRTLNFALSL